MIFLGLPTHGGGRAPGMAHAIGEFERDFPGSPWCEHSASLLCWNFNALYAAALNNRAKSPNERGITHFLLLHDDVRPMTPHWAKVLLAEMRERELGAISAVIPIKNDSGETSTAIDVLEDGKLRVQKLKLGELPAEGTITSREEPRLLINTGMLLIDVTQPWADRLCFRSLDEIRRNETTGLFEALCSPEDWTLSRWFARERIAFGATTKVRVLHYGATAWGNFNDPTAKDQTDAAGQ